MSVSASINLRIINRETREVASQELIICSLIDNGWSLSRSNGFVNYLPIGDNDDCDWIEEAMSLDALFTILKQKEHLSELIGVVITWENTDVGGDLLLWGREETKLHTPTTFGVTVNRRETSFNTQFKFTDFNWYLDKIMPAVNNANLYVEFFSCDHHI